MIINFGTPIKWSKPKQGNKVICELKCPKCGQQCLDDNECSSRSHRCICGYYWNQIPGTKYE